MSNRMGKLCWAQRVRVFPNHPGFYKATISLNSGLKYGREKAEKRTFDIAHLLRSPVSTT